ncbi:MAG: InlB B-repeat-containing protein [Bifidobacteriaceae bacterium]|jgi:hypothetical protein|nr:InlB B-repeat-containing protein [Bifidobacteriaceae bacterium]
MRESSKEWRIVALLLSMFVSLVFVFCAVSPAYADTASANAGTSDDPYYGINFAGGDEGSNAAINTSSDTSSEQADASASGVLLKSITFVYGEELHLDSSVVNYYDYAVPGSAASSACIGTRGQVSTDDAFCATHTFLGWADTEGSSTVVLQAGQTLEPLPSASTFYGVWKSTEPTDADSSSSAAQKFAVQYEGNGDSAASSHYASYDPSAGERATVESGADLVRKGYTFTGWNTQPNGSGTEYQPGDVLPPARGYLLFAQWKENAPATDPGTATGSSATTDPSNGAATDEDSVKADSEAKSGSATGTALLPGDGTAGDSTHTDVKTDTDTTVDTPRTDAVISTGVTVTTVTEAVTLPQADSSETTQPTAQMPVATETVKVSPSQVSQIISPNAVSVASPSAVASVVPDAGSSSSILMTTATPLATAVPESDTSRDEVRVDTSETLQQSNSSQPAARDSSAEKEREPSDVITSPDVVSPEEPRAEVQLKQGPYSNMHVEGDVSPAPAEARISGSSKTAGQLAIVASVLFVGVAVSMFPVGSAGAAGAAAAGGAKLSLLSKIVHFFRG